MRPDVEYHNHKLHLADMRGEARMLGLAEGISPTQTVASPYQVIRQKLSGVVAHLRTKRATETTFAVGYNRLLRPDEAS
jgi:hypothetical protein